MTRMSREEQLRQLAALPPDLLVRQVRLMYVFLSIGAILTAVAMAVVVFGIRGGKGLLPPLAGPISPPWIASLIGMVSPFVGWILGRPWRAALRGDRPPTTRREFVTAIQAGHLALFLSEGGVMVTAIAFLLGGDPALLAPLAVTLAFLLFQRVDPDRAAELVRHVEGLPEG